MGFNLAGFTTEAELADTKYYTHGSPDGSYTFDDRIPSVLTSITRLIDIGLSNITFNDVRFTFCTHSNGTRTVSIVAGSSQAQDVFLDMPKINFDRPMSTMAQVPLPDRWIYEANMRNAYAAITGKTPPSGQSYDLEYQLNSDRQNSPYYAGIYINPDGSCQLHPAQYADEHIYFVGPDTPAYPGGVIADFTDRLYQPIPLPDSFLDVLCDKMPTLEMGK
jgi:hypothetical protein